MQTVNLWDKLYAPKSITVFACASFNEGRDSRDIYCNTLHFFQIISIKQFLFWLQI